MEDAGRSRQTIQQRKENNEKSEPLPRAPRVNLAAEAVLDPAIQPLEAIDEGVDLTDAKAIFLTGASGFLGAYLLYELITATEARVCCLVRCRSESEGATRIKDNLLQYGLWNDDFGSRIIPLPGDLSQPLLGVEAETFDMLCNLIDAIYHNGAVVNFTSSYADLKGSNVRGTEEVIRLASRIRRKTLNYISTVGVFPPGANHNTRILESDAPDNWQALIEGYRQSKWVAERMVTIAGDRGLPVRIYRPGFVAGDTTTGIWNTDDFLPRMLKGCIQLGSSPDSNAAIQMAPVDYVSKTIIHLSSQRELQPNVFHLVSAHHIPARELGLILDSLGYKMTVVSYKDWRNALLDSAKTSSKNALFPLLPMFTNSLIFDQMPIFDCHHTLEALRGTQLACPEIDTNLIATYLAYFKKSGFLDA